MQITMPSRTDLLASGHGHHTTPLSSREVKKNRLFEVCQYVREAVHLEKENQHVADKAIRSIEGLRSDLLGHQFDIPIKKHALSTRKFTIYEIFKLGGTAVTAVLGLALVIINIANLIFNTSQKATTIANTVVGAAMTIGAIIFGLSQAGIDFHTRRLEFLNSKEREEEEAFVKNMEILIQNLEWLLENYKTNPVACHKYIGNCYLCLKKMPAEFIEQNEDIRLLIQNLVHLLPENDILRNTLESMGAHDAFVNGNPLMNSFNAGVLRTSKADSASFSEPVSLSTTNFNRLSNLKTEDIISPIRSTSDIIETGWIPTPQENINALQVLMGVPLDAPDINRLILTTPRDLPVQLTISGILARAAAGEPLTETSYANFKVSAAADL